MQTPYFHTHIDLYFCPLRPNSF